jgi:hypothetical protein
MLSRAFRVPSLVLVLAAIAWPAVADAKPKKEKEPPAEEANPEEGADKAKEEENAESEKAAGEGEGEAADGEEKEKSEEGTGEAASPTDSGTDDSSPVEDPKKTYYFLGARFRGVVIPSFIIEAFGDGGKSVFAPSFGPEFAIRKDNFEWIFSAAYTAYTMTDVPFKAPTDPPEAMELVSSEMKVLYFTADFYWSHPISTQFQFLYGGGAGLGIVWGPLYRSQAYPTADGGWEYCPGPATPMNPGPNFAYCSPDPELTAAGEEQHYIGYEEPNWFDGGSKPVVMPWLAIQAGLRFKPHRAFAARLDVGIGLGQVFFGLGADYGL